ncbi:MAG: substrate-binding domain-containing protein [Candidatus Verstraetearchaeota archaeon]|nr:substrate-binding domain-containing protein [Candidatus Verstraetearchaeota archaeon]
MDPKFRLWLEEGGSYIIGEKEARILEGIRRYGSIMSAAKSMGITYAHAWNLIERLSLKLGTPIVSARRGGESGGGATLTDAGSKLLSKYLELEERIAGSIGVPRTNIFCEVTRSDLVIAGSSCFGVKIIAKLIEKVSVEVIEIGSKAGVTAVMLGEADVAGIHIFDEKTKTYNTVYLKSTWTSGTAIMIKGYIREQGLIVRRGNPKGIRSLRDAVETKATIVNRNLGSGTRDLLERLMKEEGVNRFELKGYDHEVRSHEEVAIAIKSGAADFGLGIRAAALAQDLDFIKICDEEFDFVCDSRMMHKAGVKTFVETLKSENFRRALEIIPGLSCTSNTGDLIEIRE